MDTGHRLLATLSTGHRSISRLLVTADYALPSLPFSAGVMFTLLQSVEVPHLDLSLPCWRSNRAAVSCVSASSLRNSLTATKRQ